MFVFHIFVSPYKPTSTNTTYIHTYTYITNTYTLYGHSLCLFSFLFPVCNHFSRGVFVMLGTVSEGSFDTFHSYSNTFQMPFLTWFPEKVKCSSSFLHTSMHAHHTLCMRVETRREFVMFKKKSFHPLNIFCRQLKSFINDSLPTFNINYQLHFPHPRVV